MKGMRRSTAYEAFGDIQVASHLGDVKEVALAERG
jgi:hypothetical protein